MNTFEELSQPTGYVVPIVHGPYEPPPPPPLFVISPGPVREAPPHISPIPEPSAWILLLTAAAIAVLWWAAKKLIAWAEKHDDRPESRGDDA